MGVVYKLYPSTHQCWKITWSAITQKTITIFKNNNNMGKYDSQKLFVHITPHTHGPGTVSLNMWWISAFCTECSLKITIKLCWLGESARGLEGNLGHCPCSHGSWCAAKEAWHPPFPLMCLLPHMPLPYVTPGIGHQMSKSETAMGSQLCSKQEMCYTEINMLKFEQNLWFSFSVINLLVWELHK